MANTPPTAMPPNAPLATFVETVSTPASSTTGDMDLEQFRGRLVTLHTRIGEILAAAPPSWQPSYSDKVESHLSAAASKADRFCEAIEWRLAK